ncbi:MAG: Outer rane efflux protein [Gemmataceae bacterium]|nr:Outer rane efflux protein [Gemmataceae bacterium]
MSWNRWTAWVLRGLVAIGLAGLVGCKQQIFMEPGDYQIAVTAGLPPNLGTNPHDAILPSTVDRHGDGPSTVRHPNYPARYVTLKECIAVALEQGNTGFQNPLQLGNKQDILPSFTGGTVASTDAIRAFALDPANVGSNIERALSKFDARWITSMQWQKNDNPVAAQFVSFQSQNDTANLSTALVKPLPTGGVAGITFSVNYTKFSNIPAAQATSFISPNYTPQLQFVFEQPLLQLFGVEVNQLTNIAPTSLLITGLRPSGGQTTEGILLTRIRYDQSRADFERVVNYLLVSVETAYWNLYSGYYNLYGQEEGLRQSYEGYRFTQARVGAGTDPPQQLDQARAQLELFRVQVIRARGQVLESERQLRGLMGLRSDDGTRLVPIDEPNLARFEPDYYDAANEAIAFRPELMIAREDLKAQQLNNVLQKNLRRPDLRFYSSYNIAGLGTRLDGSETILNGDGTTTPGNALANFQANRFNSWTLGLRMDMPLGFRDQNAAVRQGQLQLTRSYIQLRDSELKTLEYLTSQYRQVIQTFDVLPPLRARREALQLFLYKFRVRIEIGQYQSTEYINYLQGQRDLADAIAQEFAAIAQYNAALAAFEFARGTILRYNNISLSEGPLPPGVQKRAKDHERERTEAAIKLRERPATDPAPVSPQSQWIGPAVGSPTLPPLTNMPPPPELIPAPRPLDPKAPNLLPAPRPEDPKRGPDAFRPNSLPRLAPDAGQTTAPGSTAGTPSPDAFFTPTGSTVSLPRTEPIGIPSRGPNGAAEAPQPVPQGTAVPPAGNGPSVPPLPPPPPPVGGMPAVLPTPPSPAGGIPATLPPSSQSGGVLPVPSPPWGPPGGPTIPASAKEPPW